jgi:hypothetical protein
VTDLALAGVKRVMPAAAFAPLVAWAPILRSLREPAIAHHQDAASRWRAGSIRRTTASFSMLCLPELYGLVCEWPTSRALQQARNCLSLVFPALASPLFVLTLVMLVWS